MSSEYDHNKVTSFDKRSYDIQYAKDKIKRIPFDVRNEEYQELEEIAKASGEKISTYIKIAISERAEREGFHIFSKYRKSK